VLFSSGLIAGGAIMGVILAAVAARQLDKNIDLSAHVGWLSQSFIAAIVIYVLCLSVPLYLVGRRGMAAEGSEG
jgi:uncharacterized membrane protein